MSSTGILRDSTRDPISSMGIFLDTKTAIAEDISTGIFGSLRIERRCSTGILPLAVNSARYSTGILRDITSDVKSSTGILRDSTREFKVSIGIFLDSRIASIEEIISTGSFRLLITLASSSAKEENGASDIE